MRNDIWFRTHYPYGVVLDIENGTFALFNRFYKQLGRGQDTDLQSQSIAQLLKFIKNENVTDELKRQLEMVAKKHQPSVSHEIIEGRFFRLWFYNDATNPYAYAKQHVSNYNNYMKRLCELSNLLQFDVRREIITL